MASLLGTSMVMIGLNEWQVRCHFDNMSWHWPLVTVNRGSLHSLHLGQGLQKYMWSDSGHFLQTRHARDTVLPATTILLTSEGWQVHWSVLQVVTGADWLGAAIAYKQ